ncbi:pirin-like protein At1g50590 [Telopea speciosissima]|uniref:pirin-like protein At1g50590 n=1 Tax=Telopea speciosissima TaxID=54955 RepID=UPI001CC6B63C|nr:pirin-like protein At1g50590 [Telopea speciosissima]
MSKTEISSVLREPRVVVRKMLCLSQREEPGIFVRRSIGRFEFSYFDPFLVLDDFSITTPAGFPDHPHRGFESVTYMMQGNIKHEDFTGHKGIVREGGLQWMTAGKGIVHSEMAEGQGTIKGLQLWINLSSKHKMAEPSYQELPSKDIAEVEEDGIKVRVIAGEALGAKSTIYTRTPTLFLDFTLKPGAHLQQPIPSMWNSFIYVLEGEGVFGTQESSPTKAFHVLLLGPSGDGVEAWNQSSTPLRFVLVAGEPIGEPVVQYGPFVMNTKEEIDQTIDDFENCTNGFEKAKH